MQYQTCMNKLSIPLALLLIFVHPGYLLAQTPDTEVKIKSIPSVTYPAEASITGLEGNVTVVVDVDENGKVTKASEAYGPDSVCRNNIRADVIAMRQIAQKAVADAVFAPAMKDKKPVSSQIRVTFDFKNPFPKKPSTATIGTKIISGGVIEGTATSLPKPTYPAAARAVRATGAVDVQVLIDTNGLILKAESISGHPLLRASATEAACRARFPPTLLSGEPVMISGIITYIFGK